MSKLIKHTVIGIIIATLLSSTTSVMASTGFTGDDFSAYKPDRPAINPEFDPDYSCLFDVYQVQCIPGSVQECSRPQFGNNDDSTCFPQTLVNGEWKWMCPEGYHNVDDDETGQCYPNSEPCPSGSYDFPTMVFEEAISESDSDSCRALHYLCHGDEPPQHEKCDEYIQGYEREFGHRPN